MLRIAIPTLHPLQTGKVGTYFNAKFRGVRQIHRSVGDRAELNCRIGLVRLQ